MSQAQSADLVPPKIKLGLWEVSTNPKMGGQMPIPDDVLARMPPDRRAQLEASMQNLGNKPRVIKQCMTAEKVARGFSTGRDDNPSCRKTVVSSTSSEMDMRLECEDAHSKTVMKIHFQLQGSDQMTGTYNMVRTAGDKTMTMDNTIQGRWIASSCGSVKDIEIEH